MRYGWWHATSPVRASAHARGAPGPGGGPAAQRLSLSPKTARNYVSGIFGKLQVADRTEAMLRARAAVWGCKTSQAVRRPVRGGPAGGRRSAARASARGRGGRGAAEPERATGALASAGRDERREHAASPRRRGDHGATRGLRSRGLARSRGGGEDRAPRGWPPARCCGPPPDIRSPARHPAQGVGRALPAAAGPPPGARPNRQPPARSTGRPPGAARGGE